MTVTAYLVTLYSLAIYLSFVYVLMIKHNNNRHRHRHRHRHSHSTVQQSKVLNTIPLAVIALLY